MDEAINIERNFRNLTRTKTAYYGNKSYFNKCANDSLNKSITEMWKWDLPENILLHLRTLKSNELYLT